MTHLAEILIQELADLENARNIFRYSFEKCSGIGLKSEFTCEELESFEALTSRFARLSDMIIQKILRIYDELDLEESGTVRDRINRAEKKRIISSADDFIQIRVLRNEIAHEYKPEAVGDMFAQVMKLAPTLLESVDKITSYSKKYF